MIIVKYTSSTGREYTLNVDGFYRLKTANFHAWKWSATGTQLQYGMRLANFTRSAAQYDGRLVFMRGTIEQRAALVDQLHEDFEADLRSMTPGVIDWGGWKLYGFFVSSSTYPDSNGIWTDNDFSFFAPSPFWVYESTKIFPIKTAPVITEDYLDYPYDYDYDYTYDTAGGTTWVRAFPFPSEFLLTVYGPVANPRVLINGHPYQVNATIEAGARLVIDSRAHTVSIISELGVVTNAFDLREKTNSVFEPIPGGSIFVAWSGAFMLELTLFQERNEPTWNV